VSVQGLASLRKRAMLDLEDGRYLESERDLTEIIGAAEGATEPNAGYELGRALIDRATARRFLNRWEDALDDIERCERVAQALPSGVAGALLPNVYSMRAQLLATEQTPIFDPPAARAALAALLATGTSGWWVRQAEADLAFRDGEWQKAVDGYAAAVTELEREGWHRGAAAGNLKIGTALLEIEQFAEAGHRLRRAFAFFEEHGPSDMCADTQMELARLIVSEGDPDGAWAHATNALGLVETSVRSFRSLFDQQRFLTDKATYYQHAFRVGLAAGGVEGTWRAWAVAERAKSFYLCQLVANADVPLFDDVDPADVETLQELDDRLDALKARIRSATDAGARSALDDEYAAAAAEREELFARILRNHPRWASARTPPPFDPQHAIASLPPGWSALSMFWSRGNELHLFHGRPGEAPFHRCETWAAEDLHLLRSNNTALRGASEADLYVMRHVIPETLAARIMPPDVLQRIAPDEQLLVSPHGSMRGVPLHAVTRAGELPLLNQAIEYVPSLALLGLTAPEGDSSSVLLLGCERDGFNSRPLVGIQHEMKLIDEVWSHTPGIDVDRILLGPESRLGADTPPLDGWGQYRLVHVACHGEFQSDQPLEAALLLGKSALRMSELFALRLDADLVCLSACDLGSLGERLAGVHEAGDEWLGFTMPLLYAGARSILVSLWKADDETAARLMPAVHAGIRDGCEPAEALRSALATVAEDNETSWANWYLVGVPRGAPP
jgi:CHAT domain-containing protein